MLPNLDKTVRLLQKVLLVLNLPLFLLPLLLDFVHIQHLLHDLHRTRERSPIARHPRHTHILTPTVKHPNLRHPPADASQCLLIAPVQNIRPLALVPLLPTRIHLETAPQPEPLHPVLRQPSLGGTRHPDRRQLPVYLPDADSHHLVRPLSAPGGRALACGDVCGLLGRQVLVPEAL